MTTRRFATALVALLAWLAPHAAQAAGPATPSPVASASGAASPSPLPTPDHEAEAQAAMERGIAAMKAGDAETALEEYRRAADLVPDANLPFRYAGEALESLQRMPEAVQAYETYLKKNPYVHDAAPVQARIRRLRAHYIDSALSVSCQPEGAEVFLDDAKTLVGVTPIVEMPVRAGDHHVVVRREGYAPIDTRLRFGAGTSVQLPCTLAPLRAGVAPGKGGATPAGDRAPEADEGHGHGMRTWGFIALGSGAALVVGGLIVDATWLTSTIDDFHASAASGDGRALGLEHRAHAIQTALVVDYVVGGLLAATGAGLVAWDLKTSKADDAHPASTASRRTLSTDGSRLIFTATF